MCKSVKNLRLKDKVDKIQNVTTQEIEYVKKKHLNLFGTEIVGVDKLYMFIRLKFEVARIFNTWNKKCLHLAKAAQPI